MIEFNYSGFKPDNCTLFIGGTMIVPGDLTEKITLSWFAPLFKVTKNDKPKRILFKRWLEYANYPDWRGDTWYKPIERFINVPGGGTKRSARMVTSLILYLGSNFGRDFITRELKEIKPTSLFSSVDMRMAWADENKRVAHTNGGRRSAEVFFDEYPLSAVGFEISENTMLWLTSREGRSFLAEAYKEIGWPATWEVPEK